VTALYDYGSGNMGAFVFVGTGSGIQQQQYLWSTGKNAWNLTAGKYVVGNFAQNDAYNDIVAFYDLGNANMGSYVMTGSPNGIQGPVQKWTTGAGHFNVSQADFLPGHFSSGNSNSDVVALYDYTNANMGAFLFTGNGNGVNALPGTPLWTTGVGTWYWNETKPFVGTFAGGDTLSDLVGFYDYGNSDTGAFLYTGTGSGVSTSQQIWRTGTGQWTWKAM